MNTKENTPVPGPGTPERRALPRHSINEDASVVLASGGPVAVCRITNLSIEGCQLRTAEPFSVDARARVEVTFLVNGVESKFSGLTQWSDGRNAIGLSFVDLTPTRKEELTEMFFALEADLADRVQKQAAERSAAPKPADPVR